MGKKELIGLLKSEGYLKSRSVISAMQKVPRENFTLPEHADYAYNDTPLPIPAGQTMSAPHMYAMMLELAEISEGDKVLEVGSGSGYGAALICEVAGRKQKVFSMEVVPELADFARRNLAKSGVKNVEVIEGNGNLGLEREAPFDAIIVTAAAPEIPPALVEQLKEGGRIVIPVGGHFRAKHEKLSVRRRNDFAQELYRGIKKKGKLELENFGAVAFVPMVKREKSK